MSIHSKVILDNARDFGLLTLPGKRPLRDAGLLHCQRRSINQETTESSRTFTTSLEMIHEARHWKPLTEGEGVGHDGVDEAPGESEEDAKPQVVVLRARLVGARAHGHRPHEHHRAVVVHHVPVGVRHVHGRLHFHGLHVQQQGEDGAQRC